MSFFLLPWNWVLLGFKGLSFLLQFCSQLMNSFSPLLMVVVVSLSAPILCLASVIKLYRKMMIVLRPCVPLLVWVCSIKRCIIGRPCQSLAVDLGGLVECRCTKTMFCQSLISIASLESLETSDVPILRCVMHPLVSLATPM